MKKIVVMGGANGPSLVLRGLKQFLPELELTAVITMSDSGRSAAKVRTEYGQLPPADMLRVMIALSRYDYRTLTDIFYSKRFTKPDALAGLNIGSSLFALAGEKTGDMHTLFTEFANMLECDGTVLPVTLDMTDLVVELTTGEVIRGEGNIDCPSMQCAEIENAWLEPAGNILPEAAAAIAAADGIILGPGDLYTSNIAAILPSGAIDAIDQSSAKLIYMAGNKYTIGGEPAPTKLSKRVLALESYLPRKFDVIVGNSHTHTDEERAYYEHKKWGFIEYDTDSIDGNRMYFADLEIPGGGLDPVKIGQAVYSLL